MKNTIKINTNNIIPPEEIVGSLAKSLESYKGLSKSLSTSMSEILKVYDSVPKYNFTGISESLQSVMSVYSKMNIDYINRGVLPKSILSSLEGLPKTLKMYEPTYISQSLNGIAESMQALSNSMDSEQLKLLQQIDFSSMYKLKLPDMSSFSEVVKTAYSMARTELEQEEICDDFAEEELQEAVEEQISNPVGFQEEFANWSDDKKKKYYIFYLIMLFLYSIFLQPFLQEKVGMPVMTYCVSVVKELPEKGAVIIDRIEKDIKAIIIEDTNYYYKVSYIDENGETKEGYVAKRNLKLIEQEESVDETEEQIEK